MAEKTVPAQEPNGKSFEAFSNVRKSALRSRRDELILEELNNATPREVAYIFNVTPQLVSYIKQNKK